MEEAARPQNGANDRKPTSGLRARCAGVPLRRPVETGRTRVAEVPNCCFFNLRQRTSTDGKTRGNAGAVIGGIADRVGDGDTYSQETLKRPALDFRGRKSEDACGQEHAACGSINEANHSCAESPYSSGDIIHALSSSPAGPLTCSLPASDQPTMMDAESVEEYCLGGLHSTIGNGLRAWVLQSRSPKLPSWRLLEHLAGSRATERESWWRGRVLNVSPHLWIDPVARNLHVLEDYFRWMKSTAHSVFSFLNSRTSPPPTPSTNEPATIRNYIPAESFFDTRIAAPMDARLSMRGKMSIRALLGEIGAVESVGDENDHGRCAEKLDVVEMKLFADLLEKMMRYCPEERLTMSVIVSHLWFSLE
ncbi:hypothetical protein BJ912DRAFT_936033 [Pholiota molesta]|nr:hypothetical protein BJ912DRAFT_936033 [Pholiota molesta]